ncbi:integrator complex subunit 2 isoform X4 [Lampetra fluviatilis]
MNKAPAQCEVESPRDLRAMLSSELPYPSPRAFEAMVCVDTAALSELTRADLRLLLPCLVRMALCAAADQSVAWAARKRHVLRLLSAVEPVNAVVALLSVDFHALEQEARRELHARRKSGAAGESVTGAAAAAATAAHGLALEFEHSDPTRRLHLVLSELLSLITRASGNNADASGEGAGGAGGSSAAAGRDAPSSSSSLSRGCELFECDVYLQEVADVLSILLAELPALLPMAEVAEALLLARHGAWFLCLLVANTPDCFTQVCRGLIHGGGSQDDDSPSGRRRVEALRQLCRMKPSQALNVRAMAVEACRLPSLAVALTLDQASEGPGAPEGVGARGPGDLVSFVSGLLLGSDARVRNWFTAFVKAGQQKRKGSLRGSLLAQMRQHLLSELHSILPHGNRLHGDRPHHGDRDPEPGGGTPSEGVAGEAAMEVDEGASAEGAGLGGGASAEGAGLGGGALAEEEVVRGGALLRLYCALMGIAGLRPSEEEVSRLLALITSRPPATAAGVRFVSLSLATLLAFTALVSTPRQEQIAVSWLNWMIREEAYFESKSGVAASFGEVLLLVAMYFHSNQLNSIVDLVCSTLGMKIPMKQNSLAKMKIIFTQDVFTEQVVTAHAVRVPVTPGLNAAMSGFLPVHCTYQLLRGRAFTKHKVPIKDWILAQVCESRLPLHSQLLPLLDAFITSVFTPASKANPELINQPMSEHSLLVAFQQQDASVSAQLLILYYILSYEEAFLTHARTLGAEAQTVLAGPPRSDSCQVPHWPSPTPPTADRSAVPVPAAPGRHVAARPVPGGGLAAGGGGRRDAGAAAARPPAACTARDHHPGSTHPRVCAPALVPLRAGACARAPLPGAHGAAAGAGAGAGAGSPLPPAPPHPPAPHPAGRAHLGRPQHRHAPPAVGAHRERAAGARLPPAAPAHGAGPRARPPHRAEMRRARLPLPAAAGGGAARAGRVAGGVSRFPRLSDARRLGARRAVPGGPARRPAGPAGGAPAGAPGGARNLQRQRRRRRRHPRGAQERPARRTGQCRRSDPARDLPSRVGSRGRLLLLVLVTTGHLHGQPPGGPAPPGPLGGVHHGPPGATVARPGRRVGLPRRRRRRRRR